MVFVCRNKLISKYLPKFEIVIFVHGKGLRLELLHFSHLCCYQMCRLSQVLETIMTNPSIVLPQNEEVLCTFNVFPLTHTKGVKVENELKTKQGRLSEFDVVEQSDSSCGLICLWTIKFKADT